LQGIRFFWLLLCARLVAGRQRRRRRPGPAAAGYLLLFSMRASLKANRSGPVRATETERAQQAHSHLFLRATNQQSLASSLGSTGNASYKVSHLCSKSKNCCRCRRSRVSERASARRRERRRDSVGTLPLTKYNPSRLVRLFFPWRCWKQRQCRQAADARRRSLPPPIHAFARGHAFPILGKATLWAPARPSQGEKRAARSLGCVALSQLDRSIFYL